VVTCDGDPAAAFDVVVPSLPGFLYSEPLAGPFTHKRVAETWHALMTHTLGYPRFGAFGGDIGGTGSARTRRGTPPAPR
jgi:pimeloyl-ACP methyl ester carboxylesterase